MNINSYNINKHIVYIKTIMSTYIEKQKQKIEIIDKRDQDKENNSNAAAIKDKIIDSAVRKNIEQLVVLQLKVPEEEDFRVLLNRLSIFIKIIESGHTNIRPWKAIIKILEYLNCYEDILTIMRQFIQYFENDVPENILKILDEKTFFKTSLNEKHIYHICGNEILNLQNPGYIYSDLLIKLYKDFGEKYAEFMTRIIIPSYASLYISAKSVENRIIAICIPTFNGTMENIEVKYDKEYENKKVEALDKLHKNIESQCKNRYYLTKEKVEVFSCKYSECLKMVQYMQIFENTHSVFYIVSNKNKHYADVAQLKKENGMLFILNKDKIIILNKMLFRWCFNMIEKKNEDRTMDFAYMCHASKLKNFKYPFTL